MIFSDYLNVSLPEEGYYGALEELAPLFLSLGIHQVSESLWRPVSGHGTVKANQSPRVNTISCSGGILGLLRQSGYFSSYLSILGQFPHRVTTLHAANDFPQDAGPVIRRFDKSLRKGKVRFNGRKVNPETGYSPILTLNRGGELTGSIYVGAKSKSIQTAALMVYDKQKEQWGKFNREIPPTLRYEVKVGRKAGATLRDAHDPTNLFWHFTRDILEAPPGTPAWEPHAEGFDLPPRIAQLPASIIKRALVDKGVLDGLLHTAESMGTHGLDYLVCQVRTRYSQITDQPDDVPSEDVGS